MRIGLKLDIDFHSNHYYRDLFGTHEIPSYLKSVGIGAVEFPIGPTSDYSTVKRAALQCIEQDLRVSLHPYTENTPFNPALFEVLPDNSSFLLHEKILKFAAGLVKQNGSVVVNFHAAAYDSSIDRPTLMSRSVDFFYWVVGWCQENSTGVIPVAELQIAPNITEPLYRIGDNFGELAAINRITNIGLCYDFGHALLNKRRFNYDDIPNDTLRSSVCHIHCHDVYGDDHHALLYGGVPWRRYLSAVVEHGFDGTIILEVPPEKFIADGGLSTLVGSVDEISKFIKNLSF